MSDWETIKKLGGRGILSRQDVVDLTNQRNRVLYLMLDGKWHTAAAIREAAQGSEGLRRLRELREIPGVTVERTRGIANKRNFLYRLKFANGLQGDLF